MEYKTNIFKKIYKCLYNVDSFSEYAKQGIKSAILYILTLSIALGIIKGIGISYRMSGLISKLNNIFTDSAYNFNIDNNTLNIAKSPIKIEENNVVVYIDNKKNMNEENEIKDLIKNSAVGVCLLDDGMIVQKYGDTIKKEKYNEIFENGILDKNILMNSIKNFKIVAQILICIYNVLLTIINVILNLLIVVILGGFISVFLKMVVKPNALWALVIYSATLPLLLVTVFEVIRPTVDFSLSVILGNLTYLTIILLNIKSDIIEKIKSGKL